MQQGKIYCQQAYLQGKLLDHSGWADILPRAITPSDIDMVIDNAGRMLFVELSSHFCRWADIPIGQQKLYRNLVRNAPGKHFAALAKHNVQYPEQIDTTKDIEMFQLLYWNGEDVTHSKVFPGERFAEWTKRILKF